jgi:hypothetical protein
MEYENHIIYNSTTGRITKLIYGDPAMVSINVAVDEASISGTADDVTQFICVASGTIVAKGITPYTAVDLSNAIISGSSTAVEDDIIKYFDELITYSGSYSGETWVPNPIAGTSGQIATWRTANYYNVYWSTQMGLGKNTYTDSTKSGTQASDFTAFANLTDFDYTDAINYTISGTIYLDYRSAKEVKANAVRLRTTANCLGFFACSQDGGATWTYFCADPGTHTSVSGVIDYKYNDLSYATSQYLTLPSGNNYYLLPNVYDGYYFRLYLTTSGVDYSVGVQDFAFTNLVQADDILAGRLNTNFIEVASNNGRLNITGDLITIMDENGVVRVKLGRLE